MPRRIVYTKKSAYECDLKTNKRKHLETVPSPRVETFHKRISWMVCKLHYNDEIDAITSDALKHTACFVLH